MNVPIKILAVAGSIRSNSSSASIVQQLATLVPAYVQFTIYTGLGNLPAFNDSNDAPVNVLEWRHQLQQAEGVILCTPEYAFGVPGVLKNALDWTVGSGDFVGKPVALITAATGGDKAHASLLLTLTALSANVTTDATLLISFIRSKMNETGEVVHTETLQQIKHVLQALLVTAGHKQAI